LVPRKRTKIRISNAGFTLTALPLLAAKDWGVFSANGLDVELIVMSPTLAAAAVAQGDIDYVAGVGPASVAATLSGLPSRAIWFSSDRITYWLQSAPPYKTLQDLKGKKIALSGGVGGTNHVALMIALEKSGANPKEYAMVGIPGQRHRYSIHSNRTLSRLRFYRRRICSSRREKDLTSSWMSARWLRCPAAA
jgi:ABC-type nitrate/sulfonate/bicarbonate transport system substrate-binding protein